MRHGKVVRYVPQRGAASPYYVVDVGEYQSIEVPAHKIKEEVELDEGEKGLWHNIHKKKERGEKMRKKGDPGAPTAAAFKKAQEEIDEGRMSDLHLLIKQGKSAEQIAKLMKLDVKTIKTLMNDFRESARSDALRSIRRDKDLGKRSDVEADDSATDADIKGASKNIIMQMRKVVSLNGRFAVEFEDKKKVKIPVNIAAIVQQKFDSFRKPIDKEKFQAKVAKSYKSMLTALKENKTILDRISKKIQERKNG